jgi:hypothetical protein
MSSTNCGAQRRHLLLLGAPAEMQGMISLYSLPDPCHDIVDNRSATIE